MSQKGSEGGANIARTRSETELSPERLFRKLALEQLSVLDQRGKYFLQQVENLGRHRVVATLGPKLGDVSALIGDSTSAIFNMPINLGQVTCRIHRRASYHPTRNRAERCSQLIRMIRALSFGRASALVPGTVIVQAEMLSQTQPRQIGLELPP
jgi:hypothetical protein